jgi:hypothetical protein
MARWTRLAPRDRKDLEGPALVDEAQIAKWVDDRLHSAGIWIEVGPDATLAPAAVERVRRTLRPDDALANIGGGRMAVFLPGIRGRRQAMAAAGRIERRLSEPFEVGGEMVQPEVSLDVRTHTRAAAP